MVRAMPAEDKMVVAESRVVAWEALVLVVVTVAMAMGVVAKAAWKEAMALRDSVTVKVD